MAIVSSVQIHRGVVEIYLDGYAFAKIDKKTFAALPLCEGTDIDEDEYLDRVAQVQFPLAYEAALSALDICARSEGELRRKLLQKGFVARAIEPALNRLKENRLLDDAAYAERLVENQAGKPVGAYAVKQKLRRKGFDEAQIEEALAALDDAQQKDAARRLAEKLYPKYADREPREGKTRLIQAMQRRGFAWEAIEPAVEALFSAADEY